jgi:hypothetical protein
MSWSLIAYIFLCIVVGLGSFVTINNSGRSITAIVSLILFILIFVLFGLRWFRGGVSVFAYQGVWPPIINMCPDYLVYYKKGTTETCIDLLGVNRSGGALKTWSKEDNPSNPPEDSAKYFPYVYKPGMTLGQLQTLCDAARNTGLTWEGITNGESCTFTSSQNVITATDGTKCTSEPSKAVPSTMKS